MSAQRAVDRREDNEHHAAGGASEREGGPRQVARLQQAVGNQALQVATARAGAESESASAARSEHQAERAATAALAGRRPTLSAAAPEAGHEGGLGDGTPIGQRLTGGGQPLTPAQRALFEPRFGADLRDVRVHTGPNGDAAARAVGARAVTTGENVAFRNGEYEPWSRGGTGLLAHELAHVVQQRRAGADAVQAQSDAGAVPNPKQMRQGDSLPLEDAMTPQGIQNAPLNLVAFVEGLISGTTLTWSQLGTLTMKAYDPRAIVHLPEYFTGILEGVYNGIKGYVDMIVNVDEFVQMVLEFAQFLVFKASPSNVRTIGAGIAEQYSSQLAAMAELEAGEFYHRLGTFVGPLLLDLLLSAVGVGIAGKASKLVKKLRGIIPDDLLKKADDLVELPDRKKGPDAERPDWHSEQDRVEYWDEEGKPASPVERAKRGLDTAKLKRLVTDRWARAIARNGPERPVKVVPRSTGGFDTARGYITELRYVRGASPRRMEEILGLPEGKLTGDGESGAIVQRLKEAPEPGDIELKGQTTHPAGEYYMAGDDYLKGSGVPQWELTGEVAAESPEKVGLFEAYEP